MHLDLEQFIRDLQSNSRYSRNIVASEQRMPRAGEYASLPEVLKPELKALLAAFGIGQLYRHQFLALEHIWRGEHVLVTSGVASGKSLCYQLPILSRLLDVASSRALLLFPTKALAQDQHQKLGEMLSVLQEFLPGKKRFRSGIYDGDTPSEQRSALRKSASLLCSNPDMLHLGILPHHPLWADFFANLDFVVIDELHIYRGVFGSQFANVLRRLQRICRFYGSHPQFICSSATLSNARELCGKLIQSDVFLVEEDASPQGEKQFFIYNPPLIDEKLGIRRSTMLESSSLARRFLSTGCQAILFTETRRNVEILYRYLCDRLHGKERIRSYRSGYLAENRREVERDLRSGALDLVVSTNALELGIDIGGLDAIFLNGYPGTIAGTRQQSGRAGRKGGIALTVLVASANPLDQYICLHPEYLFERNPEQALIDPDNTEILLKQLECAIAEMAMFVSEGFGDLSSEQLLPYLRILLKDGRIRLTGNKYTCPPGSYPAGGVSLRNMTANLELVCEGKAIGFVDESSARWMTHKNAVYLHEGETWLVQDLDLEQKKVTLLPSDADYYTQASQRSEIELIELISRKQILGGRKHLGRVLVTTEITGYKKMRFFTQEILGYDDLDLPPARLDTIAFWLSLSDQSVDEIRSQDLWRNDKKDYGKDWEAISIRIRQRDGLACKHCGIKENGKAHDVHHIIPLRKFTDPALANREENLLTLCPRCHALAERAVMIQSGLAGAAYLLKNLAPFFVMCAQKDIGVHYELDSPLAESEAIIAIYDTVPGGIGLSRRLYEIGEKLVLEALSVLESCPCENGCPSCTGPVMENGEGAKTQAKAIFIHLCVKLDKRAEVINFPKI